MSKKALLIIDVQKYYLNDGTKSIPLKIVNYIKQNNFDYILFTKFINHKNTSISKIFNWNKMFSSPDTDICDTLLDFIEKDNVFEKDTYSAFKSKLFINFLNKNNIMELSLCGFDTDACILATAYEGFDLGYKISVLNDLTSSHSGKLYEKAGLDIINKNIQI